MQSWEDVSEEAAEFELIKSVGANQVGLKVVGRSWRGVIVERL